jgi:hypothetical protein
LVLEKNSSTVLTTYNLLDNIYVALNSKCVLGGIFCDLSNRGVGYMDVGEELLPYRSATNILLQIKKKCFILQNIY